MRYAKLLGSLLILSSPALCQFPAQVNLQPDSAVADSAEITMTVSGRDFLPGMVVRWNGEPRETKYIYSGALSVRITPGDLAHPTLATVAVWNSAGDLQFSETAYFLVYVELWNHDFVWDPARSYFYVSVPSRQGADGQSIVAINPESGAIERRLAFSSEPQKLAISADARYLFVGFEGLIRRIDLNTWVADAEIPLGTDESGITNRPGSMLVLPGGNESLLVSFSRARSSPSYGGTAVFDGARKRTKQLTSHSGGPAFLAGGPDASTIYGGSGGGVIRLRINSEGVEIDKSNVAIPGSSLVYDRGLVYASSGLVIDAPRLSVIDRFPAGGLILPVPRLNRTLMLGGDFQPGSTVGQAPPALMVFDHTTKERLATIPLPVKIARAQGRFIRWGDDGIAFSDVSPYEDEPTNRFYILRVPGLAAQ